jgi:hypothetical protein
MATRVASVLRDDIVISVSGGANPRKYGGKETQFCMAVSAKLPHLQPRHSVGLLRRVKGSLRQAEARP